MESRVMVTARKFPELGAAITAGANSPEPEPHANAVPDWGEETTEPLPFVPRHDPGRGQVRL
jgi:hypothetical protein